MCYFVICYFQLFPVISTNGNVGDVDVAYRYDIPYIPTLGTSTQSRQVSVVSCPCFAPGQILIFGIHWCSIRLRKYASSMPNRAMSRLFTNMMCTIAVHHVIFFLTPLEEVRVSWLLETWVGVLVDRRRCCTMFASSSVTWVEIWAQVLFSVRVCSIRTH